MDAATFLELLCLCVFLFCMFAGCDLEKDTVTCEVKYGGLLLLNNLVPHQR